MAAFRRLPALPAVLLALALAVTACGGPAPAPAGPAPASAAFPVTVEHEFGATVVPAAPQRVVSVGYTEQDYLLALGVTPVGVTDWYGDQPNAVWPWARAALGSATPQVLSSEDGFQYEKIAALRPDLIVGTSAGIDKDTFTRLSAIAPTIAQPKGAPGFFAPWKAQTELIGAAVGKRPEAASIIADIDRKFADAAAAHPQFAGRTVIFLQAPFYDGKALAYPAGLSTAFLTGLGFTVPHDIDAFVTGSVDFKQAMIPLERLSVLNSASTLIWATEDAAARTELEKQPLYRQLTPVKEGKLVFTDATLAGAIYFSSPLSLPYVIDHLVPRLEKAVVGDPTTLPAG